jgi:hypothetical protein
MDDSDFPVGEDEVFAFVDPAERKRAIDAADSRLELDVNGGQQIANPTEHHSQAVALYATYRLARSARHPSSAAQGMLGDGGADDAASYAEALRRDYRDLVEAIEVTDDDSGGSGDGDGSGDRDPYGRSSVRVGLL